MINTVVLVGRAVRDPEHKTFNNGDTLAELAIAVDGGAKDKTTFLDVKFWNKAADVASQYLKKGHLFGLTGELRQESWEDKDGNKKSKIVVVGTKLKLMQPKGEQSEEQESETIFG